MFIVNIVVVVVFSCVSALGSAEVGRAKAPINIIIIIIIIIII